MLLLLLLFPLSFQLEESTNNNEVVDEQLKNSENTVNETNDENITFTEGKNNPTRSEPFPDELKASFLEKYQNGTLETGSYYDEKLGEHIITNQTQYDLYSRFLEYYYNEEYHYDHDYANDFAYQNYSDYSSYNNSEYSIESNRYDYTLHLLSVIPYQVSSKGGETVFVTFEENIEETVYIKVGNININGTRFNSTTISFVTPPYQSEIVECFYSSSKDTWMATFVLDYYQPNAWIMLTLFTFCYMSVLALIFYLIFGKKAKKTYKTKISAFL